MEQEQYASAIPDKAHQFPQYNYADQAAIGQTSVSYNVSQKSDNGSSIGALPSNLVYHHDPTKDSALSRDHAGSVVAANASTSSYGVANGPPDNSSYSFYPSSTNTYGYNSTDYHNYYYSNYQQQGSHTYPQQQVGSYQNTGSYQPLNSFHNANSYVATSTYSATHDDPGVIQNVGAYQAYGYNNQGSSWSSGQYGAYYPNYQATDANNTSSSIPSNLSNQQYQQPYNPWASYYGQAAPDPNCAPGTENVSAGVTSMLDHSIPGVSSGYTINSAQPPPPGTSAWQGQPADSNVSGRTSFQEPSPFIEKSSVSWTQGNPTVQNPYQNNTPLHFQNPLGSAQFSENSHSSYNSIGSQGPAVNLPFSSISENPHNLESNMQAIPPLESHKVPKLQIPTNPRIASTFPSGLHKLDKDNLVIEKANKPAYVSVSVPMPSSKESVEATESMLRPGGAFPASLRAYVERALARCKDDCQKLACQDIMKEIIKNASANGTLFTRDWDTEPLFPLPNASSAGVNEDPQSSMPFSDLSKTKRSPSRRIKSRWEPISDEKLLERIAQASQDQKIAANFNGLKDKDSLPSSRKSDGKVDGGWGSNINSNVKVFSSPQQTLLRKAIFRPEKKQRLASSLNVAENGENSSDSDKESGLTAYYSAAQALSDSPEEKKRRENRFKRFEAIHGNHATPKQSKAKTGGSQNAFARRSSALMLVRGRDDTTGRAVEDIDWDALTMKGTCQEIEKRYLRLTSAPDPSTVRPEEVLEKALLMVQTTQKNYLYKCDQLKSIRQDLTVQRIRNKLTVKVYETHARLALEAGDLPEYNQCQSQLKGLYSEGIEGSQLEFAAYNLLCAILHSNNNRDLLSSMASLPLEAKKDESVRHALAVQAAVATGNYVTFFRLYCTAPNLSTCLMDLYVEKMRFEAVRCLSRAYRPTIPVSFIAHILGFGSTTADEGSHEKDPNMLECEEWLRAHGGCLIVDNTGELMLDAKATTSSLYMPDPEDAVAHGDATLDVNDFLTRT